MFICFLFVSCLHFGLANVNLASLTVSLILLHFNKLLQPLVISDCAACGHRTSRVPYLMVMGTTDTCITCNAIPVRMVGGMDV